MAEKLKLELVTPYRHVLSQEVDELTAPGTLGEFGVLPGHTPLLTTLRIGELTYKQGAQLFHVAETFTGTPGKYVELKDTIRGFRGIVDGQYDDIPEQAFYLVGTMEEALEKAKQLAA